MILAPFGVGTIDQALMSVIAVKHSSVRAFGLAGKVVILDEVHSYDSYTGTLIEALIKELLALGSTVIVLSATLRKSVRAGLLGLPADRGRLSSDYPLVTSLYPDGEMKESGALPVSERTICIKHGTDIQEAIDSAIYDAMSCKYVLWIENSVSDAQNAFARFSARCSGIVGVGLLHSRFLGFDRAGKEKEYTALFGKDGWINRKGKGFILVGTQILEQSLDIDADVLYTRIAPADMLFQRIGRLWRHVHPDRDGVPTCHIIHPGIEDVRKDPDVLGVSAAVYSGYVLYRTLCVFSPLESVNTPGDIRMILDSVYEDRNEEQWPRILSLKRNLDRRRRDMIDLSRRSLSKIGVVPDDFATSRYSDMRTRQVMILARIDLDRKSVILYTGEELLLSTNGKLPIERANIALKLEQSMITVPERQCPDICSPKKLLDLLSGYVFVGGGDHGADSSDELVVLLVDDHGRLMDASGNIICGYRYSTNMGYHIIKEVING